MWNKIQYALIYSWVKVHALLPMWALYILSDILYVLVYKVVRYRVKVVRQNMKASFPINQTPNCAGWNASSTITSPTTWSRRSSSPTSPSKSYNAGLS